MSSIRSQWRAFDSAQLPPLIELVRNNQQNTYINCLSFSLIAYKAPTHSAFLYSWHRYWQTSKLGGTELLPGYSLRVPRKLGPGRRCRSHSNNVHDMYDNAKTLTVAAVCFSNFFSYLYSKIRLCLLLNNMSTFVAQSCRGYQERRCTGRQTHTHRHTTITLAHTCKQDSVKEQ